MFRLIVLLTFASLSHGISISTHEVKQSFEQFKADHGAVYADAKEEAHRLGIFAQNFAKVKAHNARADQGLFSYRLGINKFSDLTLEEFVAKKLIKLNSVDLISAPHVHQKVPVTDIPKSFDWRDKGAVTGVKDQGSCGSCWSFATVASIESANFIKNGKLVSLSEQQLVDCTKKNFGCQGGWHFNAYDYIISNKGIDTETGYPYEQRDDSCRYKSSERGATISSYANVTSGDEKTLLSAAYQQPIAVAIDATPLYSYSSGVIDGKTECNSAINRLNHVVTLEGFGTEGGKDFWLLKNSWGEDWGEKGYFRFERGSNLCGIATAAAYPIV